MSWVWSFFRVGWDWAVGLFAFMFLLALIAGIVLGVLMVWDALRALAQRRALRPENWMQKSAPPGSGFTLTILDAYGHDLASGAVDVNREFYTPVRRFGMAARYALLRAGRVVREGAVVQFGPKHHDSELEVTSLEWSPGIDVHLRLPEAWFQ